MIPRRIAAAFPTHVRDRGDKYFAAGRVTMGHVTGETLTSIVRGTERYIVDVRAEPGVVVARCSCPYAADNGVCKHIWATLLRADAAKQLDGILSSAGQDASFAAGTEVIDFATRGSRATRQRAMPKTPVPPWKTLLDSAHRQMVQAPSKDPAPSWPADRRIVYIVDFSASWAGGIAVEVATERLKRDGTWEAPVAFRVSGEAWQRVPDPIDRQIAQMLIGATPASSYGAPRLSGFVLHGAALETTLRLMCDTGRCRVRLSGGERPLEPVGFDDGPPWTLRLRVVRRNDRESFLDAVLRRGGEEMLLSEPAALHPEGLLLARGALSRWEPTDAYPLVDAFLERDHVLVPESEMAALLEAVYALPQRPALELPPDTNVTEVRSPPQPGVAILDDPNAWRRTHHRLTPYFLYGP
ncbi:MAG: SWIM zinc finger family protein, partial [Gemmatimonadaceae bacterium]